MSGPWDAPRRLARSRELQGYVARRLATLEPPIFAPAPAAAPAAAPAPAPELTPVPFEERVRNLLEGLGRPNP
jgi:hypothetical protein